MPSKQAPRRGVKEYPILYSRRPFCLTSAADFNLDFLKTSLIDESLALDLHLPIKNLQYQRFSLSEDKSVWSRLTGTIKLTAQIIEKGRASKSFQFSAKVIRNLTELTGAEAVCDILLEEKLFSLPIVEEKPEKKVRKWLRNQGHDAPSQVVPRSEQAPSTWPPSEATPFYSQCRCDWSAASTHGTACCQHKGPCQHCINNLADVATEVDKFSEGPPDNTREDMAMYDDNLMVKRDTDIEDTMEYFEDLNIMKAALEMCKEDENLHVISHTEGKVSLGQLLGSHPCEQPCCFSRPCDQRCCDISSRRMTGDRLRDFHQQNRTPFGAEESTLYELDKMRRWLKMISPENPPVVYQHGNLDEYLDKEWKNLEAKKKAREELEGELKEEFEGESDDANRRFGSTNQRAGFLP